MNVCNHLTCQTPALVTINVQDEDGVVLEVRHSCYRHLYVVKSAPIVSMKPTRRPL